MIKRILYILASTIPAVFILGAITVLYHRFLPEEYHVLLDNELSNIETGLIGMIVAWVTNKASK